MQTRLFEVLRSKLVFRSLPRGEGKHVFRRSKRTCQVFWADVHACITMFGLRRPLRVGGLAKTRFPAPVDPFRNHCNTRPTAIKKTNTQPSTTTRHEKKRCCTTANNAHELKTVANVLPCEFLATAILYFLVRGHIPYQKPHTASNISFGFAVSPLR